jgi:hypothetical protein
MKDRKPTSPAQPMAARRGKTSAGLTPEIQAKIGRQLRTYYKPLDKGSAE